MSESEWIKNLRREFEKIHEKAYDSDEYEHVRSYERFIKRNALIKKYAPNRKCPNCHEFVYSTHSWVHREDNPDQPVVCRECHYNPDRMKKVPQVGALLVTGHEIRYSVCGRRLYELRRQAGLSQAIMAELLEISRSYMSKLENEEIAVGSELLNRMFDVFIAEGVVPVDVLLPERPSEAPGTP